MQNRMNATHARRFAVLGSVAVISACVLSCSPAGKDSTVHGNNGTAASSATAATGGSAATGGGVNGSGGVVLGNIDMPPADTGPCKGLECQVQACTNGAHTTISGKIYDPAGKVPLYNVAVYVPNPEIAPVEPFKDGASCDRCGASIVNPVTAAVTDETGGFVLQDAPVGANIPLVMQVGKWRRQVTIPMVNACADNALSDPQMMRLPRNKAEGDIPKIAITVGSADQMECLPLRLGIDPAEFTTAAGDGRIHLYEGHHNDNRLPVQALDAMHGGATITPADDLWSTKDALMKYDIVILSCEGDSFQRQKPMGIRQAMYDYASAGGRVFASHWHNIWFAQGPNPVPTTGTWTDRQDPTDMGAAIDATINQSFPKGAALAKWLVNVQASTTLGTMMVTYPRDNLQAINPMVARDWITVQNPKVRAGEDPTATEYMSFNAPIGVPEEQICGRAVYTDLHVASVDNNTTSNALGFPASCEMRDLSAQEKAVAFMLFDLSACVQNEDQPPKPPK
jgi:hypothetical protein